MPTSMIVVSMLVVVTIVIGSIVALPLLASRLTEPRWALGKSVILFFLIAFGLGIFLPVFISVPGAFTIALIRHRARVERYAARASNELQKATDEVPSAGVDQGQSGDA